ncbi:ABC transporter substrate-binding protein [Amycolatopsis thermoflava]|uniref:ABC transporter substrate-binding protein n=1 Tax=Amycolatopsis thermoflava TaxID=84480 RepID=UPI003D72F15E
MFVSRRRTLRRWALAATAVPMLVATACTAGTAGGGGPADRASLVYAYRNEVTTLDPARASYLQVDTADQLFYDTLVGYDGGTMAPRLATAFTYGPDLTSIDLTLRGGVTFHDGAPFTAADVTYSLDRYRDLGVGIASLISSYASATVTDDTHLTIKLKQADPLFLGALSRVYILNSALVKRHAGTDNAQSWLLDHDAGSGPYSLTSAASGTYTAARSATYWQFSDERPETFTLRRIDEFATARDELRAGTIDAAQIDPQSAPNVRAAGLATTPIPGGQAIVYFNTSTGPMANKAVREAVRLAYDYQGGLTGIRAGLGTIANGPLPTNMTCRPQLPTSKQDLDAARKVLVDAGLANLTLTMRFQPAFAEQAREATLLQSNLKEIGVTLDLQPIAFADYLTTLSDPATVPDIMLLTESAQYPDAGVMVTKTYWSKATGTNKSAYHNDKVDALIDQARQTPNAQARCGLYEQAQTLVDADAASMALYTTQNTYAARSDVRGIDVSAPAGGVSLAALTVGG